MNASCTSNTNIYNLDYEKVLEWTQSKKFEFVSLFDKVDNDLPQAAARNHKKLYVGFKEDF